MIRMLLSMALMALNNFMARWRPADTDEPAVSDPAPDAADPSRASATNAATPVAGEREERR
jgi:hypothetical protein